MADLNGIIRELRNRRVFRVAFLYAAAAFVVWQAADIGIEALHLPDVALTLVVLLTILGFPVALVLAWAYDITAAGLHRSMRGETEREKGGPSPRWLRLAEGVILVIATALLFMWSPWSGTASLAEIADFTFFDSVALFPIENYAEGRDMDQLSAGITEGIVGDLRRLGTIKISDPYSVGRLQELNLSTRQMADSLGVEKLILATLLGSDSGVQLNVRVSDRTGTVLSSESYQADPSDPFAAANELAHAFVDDYLAATGLWQRSVEGPSPEGPGYDSYLLGKTGLGRRTSEGLARARDAFERALEQDPEYAFAYAGLASTYVLFDTYRYREDLDGYQAVGTALAFANRAIELEPDLADAYAARLLIARRSLAPWNDVDADCQKAMTLAGASPDALSWCAQTLSRGEDADAGLRAAQQAIDIDPQNAGRRVAYAYVALALGQYEDAAREARFAAQLEPDLMLPREIEAHALLLAGDASTCARLDLGPYIVAHATCLYEMGNMVEAQAIVRAVVDDLDSGTFADSVYSDVVPVGDLAIHYAWLGDPQQSLVWLRRAFELSPTGVESRVLASAIFDRVKQDPTFASELASIQAQVWEKVQAAADAAYQERFGDH